MAERVLVLNDLHVGVQRTGGTTLASAAALRKWAMRRYERLLNLGIAHDVQTIVINGDLTDEYDIPLGEALDLLEITKRFMTDNRDIELLWALGNHDLSKDSAKLGMVAFLGAILEGWFPDRFSLVKAPCITRGDIYIIPHLPNQAQFDLALSQVPDVKYLLLHCNYDNTFAGAQDHSLNLSRTQAKAFRERGIKMVLGHEHQGRDLMAGNLIIVGNQFPTSVSDCLAHGDGQKDGKKYALLIEGEKAERICTWTPDDADGWYATCDWRELKEVVEDGRGFVRVTGEALATEAAQVIKEISAFRQRSQSFVVTNAVKIEGNTEGGEELTTQEDIRQIDVIALLLELLEPEQAAKVCELTGHAPLEVE